MNKSLRSQQINKGIWSELAFAVLPLIAFFIHGVFKSTSFSDLLSSADISYIPIISFGQTISKYLISTASVKKPSLETLSYRSSILIVYLVLSVMSLVLALEKTNPVFSAITQPMLLILSILTYFQFSYVAAFIKSEEVQENEESP
jgi:hypothetical protein